MFRRKDPLMSAPEMATADVALMLRSREGDLKAFEILYRRHYRKVQDFFHGLSRDAGASEDMCQETFLRIWRLRERYSATGSFLAYLFTFARNIWLERCRQIRRENRLGVVLSMEEAVNTLPSSDLPPDEAVSRAEVGSCVQTILDAMPEEQRMAFVMRSVAEMTLEEIAEVMGCPINTVRSRRLLAIKRLREALRGICVL